MKPAAPIAEDACHLVAGRCHATGLPPERCPMHSRVSELSPSDKAISAAERRAELRHANDFRCEHRAVDSHREEPCTCPAIVMLPIYRCELLTVDCADQRRPQAPATFCSNCPHHTRGTF